MDEHARLRSLPAVGKLLHEPTIREKFADTPRDLLAAALTNVLSRLRQVSGYGQLPASGGPEASVASPAGAASGGPEASAASPAGAAPGAPEASVGQLPASGAPVAPEASTASPPGAAPAAPGAPAAPRTTILDDAAWEQQTSVEGIALAAERWLNQRFEPHLRSVINLTGTVIHTNLGRAPLSERALHAMTTIARGYSNLEFDIPPGVRGSRHSHVEGILCELTGAEAAMAVNNNAAAVLLVLSTLGAGGDGIVSRGQLVEIGGSFRIPDIMAYSGVNLVEVGTTNKTRLADYEQAVTDHTKVIVRVHTSNYRILGFTEQTERRDLAMLANRRNIPLYEDLGSGALFDYQAVGIGDEPTVKACVRAGVDVVSFSGDKLLGGAQAGLIVGKKAWIQKMKHHPLARALRLDKMTLAALEATLMDHLDDTLAKTYIPVVRMITESYDSVASRATALAAAIRSDKMLCKVVQVELQDGESTIGGGSFPGETLSTRILILRTQGLAADKFAEQLRTIPSVPVVGRVSRDTVLWDVRTLQPGEEDIVMTSLREWGQQQQA
ncbi:L-seryl-tRNA(Sec) selenium transferase [Alicyclobacillus curvatus]|nr:L-seryl-tRNA(Sec) selenium transferase [Alicyclobacillus curvatus]